MRGCWLIPMALFGCMPTMLSTPVSSYSFASQERCAQGPFEVTLTTQEAPYGQYVKLRLREGVNQAQLHYKIEGIGYPVTGLIGTTQRESGTDSNGSTIYKPFTPPSPCLAQQGPGAPRDPYAGGPPREEGGVPTGKAPPEGPPPVALAPPTREVEFIDSPYDYGTGVFKLDLPALPPGSTIKVTLWSDLPYQLNDARIQVSLHTKYPKDPEKYAAWEAKKEERQALKAERKQKAQALEVERRQEEYALKLTKKKRAPAKKKEKKESEKKIARLAARNEKRAVRLAARAEAYWQEYLRIDASLLAEAGEVSGEARVALDKKRYGYFQLYDRKVYDLYANMPQSKAREEFLIGAVYQELTRLNKEWSAWVDVYYAKPEEPLVAKKPEPTPPPGPPPLPWAEEKGQKPTESSVWRAGYWEWSGFHWAWITGAWEIPPGAKPAPSEASVIARRPAPKVEDVPPPPAQDHVWIGGAWRWDGRAFVWVGGRWAPLVVPKATPVKKTRPSPTYKATPR